MERKVTLHLLQAMIDFFEAGNRQSDGTAKAIIESDTEYLDYWLEEIKRFKAEGEWTGLRAPEAEIIAGLLGAIQQNLEE
jgi:hypothetical protein